MRKHPDYGDATPEDVVRVLMRPTVDTHQDVHIS